MQRSIRLCKIQAARATKAYFGRYDKDFNYMISCIEFCLYQALENIKIQRLLTIKKRKKTDGYTDKRGRPKGSKNKRK